MNDITQWAYFRSVEMERMDCVRYSLALERAELISKLWAFMAEELLAMRADVVAVIVATEERQFQT